MFWGEDQQEPIGMFSQPCARFLGDMRGMIVQNETDLPLLWIVRMDCFQQLDKFTTAMAVAHNAKHMAGIQIKTGQQRDRTVALVFIVARDAAMMAGDRRQVRCDIEN